MNYLLDTNIISEIMKKAPDARVFDWVGRLDRIFLSVISYEELIYGLRRRNLLQKEAWLRQMLADQGQLLAVSENAAQWCGEKRATLEAAGRTVTQADALIAACARDHGMILATRNTRDFQGFGIPVINPFD